MLQIVITVIHVLSCIFLVVVVLLQTGKGAEMGAVFGGSSSTVFGSSGAGNFLTRLTTVMAIVFMLTSLSLTYLSAHSRTETVFDSTPIEAPPVAPQVPGGEAALPEGPPAAPPMAEQQKEAQQPAPPAPAPAAQPGEAQAPNAAAAPDASGAAQPAK
jgi:preprotein translocase subunit SecG